MALGSAGFVVFSQLVENEMSPTRVAAPGVEATLNADDLARVRLAADDVAYVSAQDLIDPVCGPAIAQISASTFFVPISNGSGSGTR